MDVVGIKHCTGIYQIVFAVLVDPGALLGVAIVLEHAFMVIVRFVCLVYGAQIIHRGGRLACPYHIRNVDTEHHACTCSTTKQRHETASVKIARRQANKHDGHTCQHVHILQIILQALAP